MIFNHIGRRYAPQTIYNRRWLAKPGNREKKRAYERAYRRRIRAAEQARRQLVRQLPLLVRGGPMKLLDAPRFRTVRLLEDAKVPPGAAPLPAGTRLFFDHVDGLYSLCRRDGPHGPVVHPAAWTEIELL